MQTFFFGNMLFLFAFIISLSGIRKFHASACCQVPHHPPHPLKLKIVAKGYRDNDYINRNKLIPDEKSTSDVIDNLVVSNSSAQIFYVSTSGNDAHQYERKTGFNVCKGTGVGKEQPQGASVKVLFGSGIYYLPETIRFTEVDNKAAVIYQAEEEGRAIISGGTSLRLRLETLEERHLRDES